MINNKKVISSSVLEKKHWKCIKTSLRPSGSTEEDIKIKLEARNNFNLLIICNLLPSVYILKIKGVEALITLE